MWEYVLLTGREKKLPYFLLDFSWLRSWDVLFHWCSGPGTEEEEIHVLALYGAFSLFNRGIRYRNIEKILIVWIVAGIIIRMGVECYYGIFVKNEMVPGRFSKYPWKPFTYTGAQRLGAMPVTDMYSEKEEVFHHFMKS